MAPHHASTRRKYEDVSSRYVDIDGRRFHYRIEGEGPTLVLLHGVMASLHTWDGWVEQLKDHYRIVRLDLPGFGLSDHMLEPAQYTPEYSVELFEKIRASFGLDAFFLCGNSLGGFLSWYYAAKFPERVKKLILIDPIAYPQKLPPVIKYVSLPGIGELAQRWAPRFLVEQNVRQVYGDPTRISQLTVDRYYELLMHAENRFAMVQTFRKLKEMSKQGVLSREINKVQCPTLLMWGEKDRWVPPALIESWKRDLQNLELKVYAGAGHIPMEEQPLETARDAHAFLSR
ncbi:MAG TPA: alpha/beta hydrolase [Polyangiales bacterium]|nr:alpha/beta hydrolase [Polyangiales bacterium]